MNFESQIKFKDKIEFVKELKTEKENYKEFLKNFYFLSLYFPLLILSIIIIFTPYFPNAPIYYRNEMFILEISLLVLSIILFSKSTLYLSFLFFPFSKLKMFFSSEYISLDFDKKSRFFINRSISIHYSEIKSIIETENFLLFLTQGEVIPSLAGSILFDKKQINVS